MSVNKSCQYGGGWFCLLRVVTVCLLLCFVGVTVLGCSDQLLGEETTTSPTAVTSSATPETTGFVVGGKVDPLAFMEGAEHQLYAEFLDTGKSDCILLRMDQTVVMVDTGEENDYTTIKKTLDEYGIQTIDYLILTHFDNDHIGSADRVLTDYTVKTVYAPDYVRQSDNYRAMMQAAERVSDRTAFHKVTEDVVLDMGYGSLWINPTRLEGYDAGMTLRDDQANGAIEENNYSLITEVTFGEATLLLTGDAEEARMLEWLQLYEDKYSDTIQNYTLVKVPHHGSHDPGITAVLRAVMPRYGVVCSDEQTVETLLETTVASVGASLHYTYKGTVLFATDGAQWTVQ